MSTDTNKKKDEKSLDIPEEAEISQKVIQYPDEMPDYSLIYVYIKKKNI